MEKEFDALLFRKFFNRLSTLVNLVPICKKPCHVQVKPAVKANQRPGDFLKDFHF